MDENINVCWLGNAGWRIRSGAVNLLIDPDLESSLYRISLQGIPEDCVLSTDAVLITHEHGDHFNIPTAKRLVKESDCRFVLPASCLHAAQKAEIPSNRIIVAHHHKPISLFGESFWVTPVPAIHGHILGSIYKHYNTADCGYLITIDEWKLFHPGDSVLLEEHLELPQLDILMVSPTEHNMHVRQAKVLIEKTNPRYIFPQHRDTYHIDENNYFWTRAYDKELYEALQDKHKKNFYTLKQGEWFTCR
ncbi:MAG: MBL fold metallo-hydrolase [Firmicutes bacterium]|nr:MBL fold metallo-hydrolase [Bacillota bacterium]